MTEQEARSEARRLLGKLDSAWYWRFWLVSARDIRLPAPTEGGDRG